jgi:hypothetical protein
MSKMKQIRLAYVANILILLPIAIPTVFRLFPTDAGSFTESVGWRALVRNPCSFNSRAATSFSVLPRSSVAIGLQVYVAGRLCRSPNSSWRLCICSLGDCRVIRSDSIDLAFHNTLAVPLSGHRVKQSKRMPNETNQACTLNRAADFH